MYQTKINETEYLYWNEYLENPNDISESICLDFANNILNEIEKKNRTKEIAAKKIQIWWKFIIYSPFSSKRKLKLNDDFNKYGIN